MADVRLTYEAINKKTGESTVVSLFITGDTEVVPAEEDGPTSMAGYKFGVLYEAAFMANEQLWTWGLVHKPVHQEYDPEEEEEDTGDAEAETDEEETLGAGEE